MSLFAQYFKERENKEVIETEKGFATYTVYTNGECYLQDIYVLPEFRKSGFAKEMVNQVADIAKSQGCKVLTGSVCIPANGSTDSLKFALSCGYKLHSCQGTMIYLAKELQ